MELAGVFTPIAKKNTIATPRATKVRGRDLHSLGTPLPKPEARASSSLRGAKPAIAIFARAPLPGRAKTRLIPFLGRLGAARFQAALLQDALHKVNTLRGHVARCLFYAGRGFARKAAGYKAVQQRGPDLGHRLERAFRALLRRHSSVVVIGTDSPLLPPRVFRKALRELRVCDAVLGPCPDGGYYLIGLRRLTRGLLRGVRWGRASAFRDTLRNLLAAGYSCSVLEPFSDVDVPRDVRRLKGELASSEASRRLAPSSWQFLKEFPISSPHF